MKPSIGLISHGTSSPEGQAVIAELAAAVTAALGDSVDRVVLGHVDVQHPDVPEVLGLLPAKVPVVLVPLLLSPGYHVHVDLAQAVAEAGDRDVRLTPTLGPDERLARILAERLPALGPEDAVVLAAAGSSDARADRACVEVAAALSTVLGREVTTGFHAGGGEKLSDIVEQKRAAGEPLVLANYLLAPGFFDDLAAGLIADSPDRLSRPLLNAHDGTPPELVELIVDRVHSAL